jgi:hypothetical protein
MGKSVRFTQEVRHYDVPVAEAEILADRLMEKADGDVTTAEGGLAASIKAIMAAESSTEIKLEGFEPSSFVMEVSVMIGLGEAGPELERLRDDMTPR